MASTNLSSNFSQETESSGVFYMKFYVHKLSKLLWFLMKQDSAFLEFFKIGFLFGELALNQKICLNSFTLQNHIKWQSYASTRYNRWSGTKKHKKVQECPESVKTNRSFWPKFLVRIEPPHANSNSKFNLCMETMKFHFSNEYKMPVYDDDLT